MGIVPQSGQELEPDRWRNSVSPQRGHDMIDSPKMCRGCGELINGEAFLVEDGPPDLMHVCWYYCEASHSGAQMEEELPDLSVAEGNE